MSDIHTKYRPKKLSDVIGQDHVVNSLKSLKKGLPHAFMFSGPSGVGKTTIARIIAFSMLKCEHSNVIEIDAATTTGVDKIRELTESLRYVSMGSSPTKFVILDEAQKLSSNAFDALLKTLEEPSDHAYFAICTTEPNKIPRTIQTRCHVYNLKEVPNIDIVELLVTIAKEENISLGEDALRLIAKESTGSPRDAIVKLSQCRGCTTTKEVSIILESALESSEAINLCRLLVKGNVDFRKLQSILKDLKDKNPESTRIVVANYLTSCVLSAKTDKEFNRFARMLDQFSRPIYNTNGFSEIVLNSIACIG